MRKAILIGLLATGYVTLQAQDLQEVEEELTVMASKSETPLSQFGNSAEVITADDIEQHQWRTVSEALHFMPGVSIARNGQDGGLTSIFLRGAASEDTLVLVNGVKMNDASGVTRGFDFAHLSTTGIERIELVLGPQSALYGSDASAGVVNIVMRDGAQPEYYVDLEGSDSNSSNLSAGAAGGKGAMDYAMNLTYSDSKDISARKVAPPLEGEEDGYTHLSGHFNLGFKVGESGRLQLGMTYVDGENDLDASTGDDPNYTGQYRQNTLSARYEGQPFEKWGYGLYASRSQTDRDATDEKDPAHPSDASQNEFKGTNLGLEFRNTLKFGESARLVGGLSFDSEEGEGSSVGESAFGPYASSFSEDADIFGVFSQLRYDGDFGFHGTLGGRYDDHSQFGSQATGQISAGYRAPSNTHIRAFYGTGYKAPSIYQLYSDFGNADLKEEVSDTTELGIAQYLLNNKLKLGATWFKSGYEDRIDFGFNPATGGFNYLNIDNDTEMSGYHVFADYLEKNLGVRVSYESLDADLLSEDLVTGQPVKTPLNRRYEDKASILLTGHYKDSVSWNLDVLWYGESKDLNFDSFAVETVDDYVLVNLGAAYQWNQHFTVRLKAENLTDEDYTQVIGYSTYGRRVFLGLRYTL